VRLAGCGCCGIDMFDFKPGFSKFFSVGKGGGPMVAKRQGSGQAECRKQFAAHAGCGEWIQQ
jgi:hypothetical protein